MCNICGQTVCTCSTAPSYNWFSTQSQPCSPCATTPVVCKKAIPSLCVKYNGPNLPNIGVNTDDTLNDILNKLDNLKMIQDLKNANILAALNDINARINVIDSGSHAPYTLL